MPDDTAFSFDDFDLELLPDDTLAEVNTEPPLGDYISRKISNMAHDPLGSKWLIADYQNMFGDQLARNGDLTPEQEKVVDEFIANYQPPQ